jgi:serine O-acetyltransferase
MVYPGLEKTRLVMSVQPGTSAWALDEIVGELRGARALGQRGGLQERSPHELPSRQALTGIVEGLRAALFPIHFAPPDLAPEAVDYFVGRTLDATFHALFEQVRRELQLTWDQFHCAEKDVAERAARLVSEFGRGLSETRRLVESDVHAGYEGDPAAKSLDEALLCYPGIHAIIHYRLAHSLHDLGVPLLARLISELAHSVTGIDIHPGAEIGASFFIDHGTGVVIGETAVIGRRVRIYQAVTLGAKSFRADEYGVLVKGEPRHPIVEDDVVIYAGATILGRIVIGSGSVIGGNVWLTHSVPPGSTITQAQVRSEVFERGAGI